MTTQLCSTRRLFTATTQAPAVVSNIKLMKGKALPKINYKMPLLI